MKAILNLLLLALSCTATAQTTAVQPIAAPGQFIFDKLSTYDTLEVVIETDMKRLKNQKETAKVPAVFKIMQGSTIVAQQDIKVKARGVMRRQTCDFPPIKLYFQDFEGATDSAEDVSELKLVSQCHYNEAEEHLVAKEMLAYELYNIITPESFRIKAAKVRITDPDHKMMRHESLAFFIEPELEVAARLSGHPIKPKVLSPKGMEPDTYDRVSLFQYMIGNTDWSIYNRHNIKAVLVPGRGAVLAIPYDFDYAGVVDAPYAIPGKGIALPNVRARYFLGMCREAGTYERGFNVFLQKKLDLLQHCKNFKYLPKIYREQPYDYIRSFFKVLETPSEFQKYIIGHCDKYKR
jgi:hypothetical protein